ncbi:DNA primase, partial [Streptomyces sp. SID10815]
VSPDGRAHFFVAPGAAAELPGLLYRMGWDDPAALDLRGLGPGAHLTAPPSDRGGRGPVRWLRPPALDTANPPEARLLLGTLAYVAHRSRA